jgi:anti-anti-sigma regulatory factor
MPEGRILYANHEHVHVLRYIGDVRHSLAPSVTAFVDSLLDREPEAELLFDFTDAGIIDSTNLGAIARIAERLDAPAHRRAAILSPRPEISEVLFSMAFDEVFDIDTEGRTALEGEPIPAVEVSREVAARSIFLAHRRLMQMSENNREQFREVVELMERELAGSEGEDLRSVR